MAALNRPVVRCAVYTRKSSEEGLEQAFNSLDAQREACQAYILSQKHEGWRLVSTRYDDGGYSGGSLERPALKLLLEDIDSGKIDTLVVYKVDRLTRSLTDFAKIIERFDAREVSFVSVTQQFNTTTSMGRLTLNVLLSFAQFEREVTGERIRDKIAASKRKGMWMGGTVPLGYDLKDRKLIPNPAEAKTVRHIYRQYLQLGCVSKVKAALDKKGIISKVRVSQAGNKSGGYSFSKGALYDLLQNRLYLGEVPHRDQCYPGEHEGIVPRDLFDRVQAQFVSNGQARRNGNNVSYPSLLAGMLFDENGNRFTPAHAIKNGKRYRYYVSQAVIQRRAGGKGPRRIPAHDIETLVHQRLRRFLKSREELLEALSDESAGTLQSEAAVAAAKDLAAQWGKSPVEIRELLRKVVLRVVLYEGRIEVSIKKPALLQEIFRDRPGVKKTSLVALRGDSDLFNLAIEAQLKRHGGEMKLIVPATSDDDTVRHPVPSLIQAVVRGHDWFEQIVNGEVTGGRAIGKLENLDERYVSRILPCAFLAPDIVEAILDGRQPEDLTLDKLVARIPLDWEEQRKQLGFPQPPAQNH
jgi:DNA invertase Pin-like site-specific DNA recombinase